jgi:hypothetical protein
MPAYFTLSSGDRTEVGKTFVGKLVKLTIDPFRNGDDSMREEHGRLVSAARLDSGTTTDVLVLRIGGAFPDRAFSGAQVREIKEIGR